MKTIFGLMFPVLLILACVSCNENNSSGDVADLDSTLKVEIGSAKATHTTMQIMKEKFGSADQKEVFLYTLTNNNGIKVKISNYGGIITSIETPDKNDHTGDIVLGYDTLSQYVANSPYFGAIVGRYANRIAKGKFTLNGKIYKLAVNNGNNSLHGGLKGFDKVVWDSREIKDSTKAMLELTYLSKDGEEGYPGNLKIVVHYSLDDHNELTILIEAETDKPSPVNLCNHTYFNLSEADTSILGHILTLYADQYTEVNSELIPTGALPAVRGTAMDFNNTVAVGERISKVKGGYDHNYVLKKKAGELTMAAQLYDPRTGRQVEILTTQPGIQFYSGNFLDGTIRGKGGKIYRKHYGLCLETQHFPDSPNQPAFPNTVLKPGVKFSETTVYRFSVIK
ncbi:MAG: galactose mutarotase [Bacteroidetes bacterium]|nr:galactose mutarotase [Bacteroidota bacterium]